MEIHKRNEEKKSQDASEIIGDEAEANSTAERGEAHLFDWAVGIIEENLALKAQIEVLKEKLELCQKILKK